MAKEQTLKGRRAFIGAAAGAALSAVAQPLVRPGSAHAKSGGKLKVALVGTGIRGSGLWGRALLERYSDVLDMVGLCDINTMISIEQQRPFMIDELVKL